VTGSQREHPFLAILLNFQLCQDQRPNGKWTIGFKCGIIFVGLNYFFDSLPPSEMGGYEILDDLKIPLFFSNQKNGIYSLKVTCMHP